MGNSRENGEKNKLCGFFITTVSKKTPLNYGKGKQHDNVCVLLHCLFPLICGCTHYVFNSDLEKLYNCISYYIKIMSGQRILRILALCSHVSLVHFYADNYVIGYRSKQLFRYASARMYLKSIQHSIFISEMPHLQF